jgi:O-methyltransferase
MKQLIKAGALTLGYEIKRVPPPSDPLANGFDDLDSEERKIIRAILPYTMTGPARIVTLLRAVRYLTTHRIPGALVECGVWKGGSMMAAARMLQALGDTSRELYLFDTFSGLPAATAQDVSFYGLPGADVFRPENIARGDHCYAGLDEVRRNLQQTGYPLERIHFVQGKVEETLPTLRPGPIALLRLDTDWYESTRHELIHLYPQVVSRGITIVDDYGHWQGARQATDEFLTGLPYPVFLLRIDYTARLWVKP